MENIFYISIVLPLIVMGYEIKSIIEGITVKQKITFSKIIKGFLYFLAVLFLMIKIVEEL